MGGSATISNCAIFNNTGTACGAAIYNYNYSNANIKNCTISGNIMQGEAVICNAYNNGVRPTMSNCIIWGNTASALIHGPTTVTYSDMQGGYLGTGNFNANPLFVNGYHLSGALSGSSVCINSGNPNYVPEPCETDLDGNPRVLYGRIDMGAYEFVTPAPGDIDGDGDIDYGDFVLFKAAFTFTQRSPNYTLRADLDADGRVTFVDYQQWLALYNEANHLTGMSSAAPAVAGDLDGDQDVDFYDFAAFAASFDNSSPIAFEDLQFIALHWLECWRFDCP